MLLPWRPVSPDPRPLIMTSLTQAETDVLRREAQGKRCLEIGAAFGYSTIVMALVAFWVVSIDPHDSNLAPDGTLSIFRRNLKSYGVADRVTTHVCSSRDVRNFPGAFDLVFIDGDHGYGSVRHDLQMAAGQLAKGGVLAVHDYGEDSCPDVRRAVDDWLQEPRAELKGRERDMELVDTLKVIRLT